VDPLLALDHGGRTRMRASVNPSAYAATRAARAPVAARLRALRRMGEASYPLGLTVAPIIAAPAGRRPTAASWTTPARR
jgi:spore photoproduct lyase